jgi:hypothetical protein
MRQSIKVILTRSNAMKLILIAITLLASIQIASATEDAEAKTAAPDKTQCGSLQSSGASKDLLAQSGCCSHHDGVCGCSGTMVMCCDNSFSPSCRCNKEEPIHNIN